MERLEYSHTHTHTCTLPTHRPFPASPSFSSMAFVCFSAGRQIAIRTDRQTDRQTDRKTNKQTDGQVGRQNGYNHSYFQVKDTLKGLPSGSAV